MDAAHAGDESDASQRPTRYALVPLPQSYSGHLWTKAPPTPPPLALEIQVNGEVRVIDAETDAVVGSGTPAQVAVGPARYRTGGGDEAWHTDPVLLVAVPGLEPLRIRPAPTKYGITYSRGSYRYSWRDLDGGADRPTSTQQPQYAVTEADWLGLVDTFGLSGLVVDGDAPEALTQRDKRNMIVGAAWFVLLLVVLAIAAYLKYAG
jgi:hypothetical protein